MGKCKYHLIIVAGENGAGKTTFAQELGAALGMQVGETSDVLTDRLARILCQVEPSGCAAHGDVAACREFLSQNKETYRGAKRALGDILTAEHPGYMVDACFAAGARVIVGLRRVAEFLTVVHPATLLITLERPGEPSTLIADCVKNCDQTGVPYEQFMNAGTVEQLKEHARAYAVRISE